MRVSVDRRDEILVLRAEGVLDPVTSPILHGAMCKAVAEQPGALVCDLTALHCPTLRHLTLLFVASDLAAEWPEVVITLACSGEMLDQLRRLGLNRLVMVHSSLDFAIGDAVRRVMPNRVRLRLDTSDHRARTARDFVVDVCAAWGASGAVETAKLLSNELVTHALRNGLEPAEIQLTLQPRCVQVLVRSRPPRAFGPGAESYDRPIVPRLELQMVERLSRGWGGRPTHDGGEILWCLVDRKGSVPGSDRRSFEGVV